MVFQKKYTRSLAFLQVVVFLAMSLPIYTPLARAQGKKPNILVIMGDDVGWFNIGAYHEGIMSDLLLSRGPSKRHELWYFGGPKLGAVRLDDYRFIFYTQPNGWTGEKVTTDMPEIVNLRQDPFERTPSLRQESESDSAWGYGNTFYAREFWRFVMVQQNVLKLAQTAIEFPPMQAPASFNLDAVKRQVQDTLRLHEGD